MSWNYRVVKKDDQLAVHGVYYDDAGKIIGLDENPNYPFGEDLDELQYRLALMNESLKQAIIDFKTLKEIK